MTQPAIHSALLEYDAARELLTGVVGQSNPFRMVAYSGGSRGHKRHVSASRASEYLHGQAGTLKSHLATTREVTNPAGRYVQRGGTLPPGHYLCEYVAHHHTFHQCIRLKRTADSVAIQSPFSPHPIPHGRGDDFFIHGSGPKGSDGCIVPANNAERLRLNAAIRDFQGTVVLLVKHVSYMLPAELDGQFA